MKTMHEKNIQQPNVQPQNKTQTTTKSTLKANSLYAQMHIWIEQKMTIFTIKKKLSRVKVEQNEFACYYFVSFELIQRNVLRNAFFLIYFIYNENLKPKWVRSIKQCSLESRADQRKSLKWSHVVGSGKKCNEYILTQCLSFSLLLPSILSRFY